MQSAVRDHRQLVHILAGHEYCALPLVPRVLDHFRYALRVFYEVYLVRRFGGTPGKLIMGVRIRKLDGEPVGYREALLRHPGTLNSMNNLAVVYDDEGKYVQSEVLSSQTLEIQRRVLGPEHPNTLLSMDALADSYGAQGKCAQAEALFNQSLAVARRVLGPENGYTLDFVSDLAFTYQRQGNYPLAETYHAQALAGRRHALGSEHPDTMASEADLALAYLSQGKFARSEPLARAVVEFNRHKQPDEWQRFRAESLLGASLAGEKKYAEAAAAA